MSQQHIEICIRTAQPGPRLAYVADFIFGEVLRLPYTLVAPGGHQHGIVLTYGTDPSGKSMPAAGLLESGATLSENPKIREEHGLPQLFPAASEGAAHSDSYPFDLFSAIFYSLTRMEELDCERDQHGRPMASKSLMAQWMQRPYVDIWIRHFAQWLLGKERMAELPLARAKWYNTLDVDIAFAYLGRGPLRQMGSSAKQLLRADLPGLKERLGVLRGMHSDPFDTYSIFLNEATHAHRSIAFLPLAGKSRYDIQLRAQHSHMQKLFARLSEVAELGIHPSYMSSEEPNHIARECGIFESVIGEAPKRSRQHFLRMQFPNTLKILSAYGIEEDFSMGYADGIGFRSGTAHPYRYYDFRDERVLPIRILPLVAMDSALKNYLAQEPDTAIEALKLLWDNVKESGGIFVSVWHNHSLSDRHEWLGWRRVYLEMATYIREHP